MDDHSFEVETEWNFKEAPGGFSRDHVVTLPGRLEINVSAAPQFGGNAEMVNPEEMLVASISSCQMMTYLFLCFKSKMKVAAYQDQAIGVLHREGAGKFWMKSVTLKPRIRFEGADSQQARALAIRLIHEAHDTCFITQSIKTTVAVEPTLVFV